jgi:hypothetical protein
MDSNDYGSYRTTRDNMMRALDKSPTVRRAFADAAFNYVPQPLLTVQRRHRLTPDTMVKLIRRWELQDIARDRTRVWHDKDRP